MCLVVDTFKICLKNLLSIILIFNFCIPRNQERKLIKQKQKKKKKMKYKIVNIYMQAFLQAFLFTAVFLQRFSFFTVYLVQWLSGVASWWTPKGKCLESRSADYCKMHFSWNFRVLFGVLKKSWPDRYIQLSLMGVTK